LTTHPESAAFDFLTRVALSYATLLDTPLAHPETGLGGKLFYAAELDEEKVEWCILELKRASAAITKRLP